MTQGKTFAELRAKLPERVRVKMAVKPTRETTKPNLNKEVLGSIKLNTGNRVKVHQYDDGVIGRKYDAWRARSK